MYMILDQSAPKTAVIRFLEDCHMSSNEVIPKLRLSEEK